MPLDERVAIVAGASRGIGADIALALGSAGAKVGVAARTEQQQDPRLPGTIHSVTKEITDAGGTATAVVLNLRDPESIQRAVDQVMETWGRIDFLVNNAAIFVPGDLETVLDRHINLSLEVNLRGYLLMMKAVLPHLKSVGGGHIINISSRAAIFPGPGPYDTSQNRGGDIFYGAEKSAIDRFSQGQAMYLQDSNIAVNALSPNPGIRTPGNIWAQNDPNNPDLNFEHAVAMGKATIWICEQPPKSYTGNIAYDNDICKANGL